MDTGWGRTDQVGGKDYTWAEVCADSMKRAGRSPARLVPDPFAEPVELPWESDPFEPGITRTTVEAGAELVMDTNTVGPGRLGMAVGLTPELARAKARALWAAADAAEKEQS